MQSATVERTSPGRGNAPQERDLLRLATPVLKVVMQLRSGQTPPSDELRRQVGELLRQMEQRSAESGYQQQHAFRAKYALTAFVDETVLNGPFSEAQREEWATHPLLKDFFGEMDAGIRFFEQLETLIGEVNSKLNVLAGERAAGRNPDPALWQDLNRTLDVLEVYYLCLILNYKGRFAIDFNSERPGTISGVADCLRRAGRLREEELSPNWKVSDQPVPQADPGLPKWVKIAVASAFGLATLIFLVLSFLLSTWLTAATGKLLR